MNGDEMIADKAMIIEKVAVDDRGSGLIQFRPIDGKPLQREGIPDRRWPKGVVPRLSGKFSASPVGVKGLRYCEVTITAAGEIRTCLGDHLLGTIDFTHSRFGDFADVRWAKLASFECALDAYYEDVDFVAANLEAMEEAADAAAEEKLAAWADALPPDVCFWTPRGVLPNVLGQHHPGGLKCRPANQGGCKAEQSVDGRVLMELAGYGDIWLALEELKTWPRVGPDKLHQATDLSDWEWLRALPTGTRFVIPPNVLVSCPDGGFGMPVLAAGMHRSVTIRTDNGFKPVVKTSMLRTWEIVNPRPEPNPIPTKEILMNSKLHRLEVESVTVLTDGTGRVVFRLMDGKPKKEMAFFAEAPLDVKCIKDCVVTYADNVMMLGGLKVAAIEGMEITWVDAADFEAAIAAYRTVSSIPAPTPEPVLSHRAWFDALPDDASFLTPSSALKGFLDPGDDRVDVIDQLRGGLPCHLASPGPGADKSPGPDHAFVRVPDVGARWVPFAELRTWRQMDAEVEHRLSDKEWFETVPYSAEFEVPEDYSVLKYKRCVLSAMRNPDSTFTDVVFDGDRPGSVSLARLRTWKMLKWPTPPATMSDTGWLLSLPRPAAFIVPPGALPALFGSCHAGGQICYVDKDLGHDNGGRVDVTFEGKGAIVPISRLRTWEQVGAWAKVAAALPKPAEPLPARVYNPAKDMVIVVKDDKEYVHLTFICPVGLNTALGQSQEFDLAVKDMKKSRGMYWSYRDLAAELARRGFVEIQHNVVRI